MSNLVVQLFALFSKLNSVVNMYQGCLFVFFFFSSRV